MLHDRWTLTSGPKSSVWHPLPPIVLHLKSAAGEHDLQERAVLLLEVNRFQAFRGSAGLFGLGTHSKILVILGRFAK